MGVEEEFHRVVEQTIAHLIHNDKLPEEVRAGTFSVERPKRADMGDIAINAALSLAKLAKKPPRVVAELLMAELNNHEWVREISMAGPGFLNLRLHPEAFFQTWLEIIRAGAGYGRAAAGTGEKVMLEFVSANPTGPLLISHARGAIVGDAVGRLLEAAGHHVTREYYINDFGNQVRTFALSVAALAFGEPLPEGGYPGAYVQAVAEFLTKHQPEVLGRFQENRESDEALAELSRLCVTRMLDGVPGSADLPGIKATLRSLGVHFDAFFSEESLHRWGRVSAGLGKLEAGGFLKELSDGALVFQLPEGKGQADTSWVRDDDGKGEQVDAGRVVRKNDGKTFTYFASDIAYHADKLERGFTRLIDVWGADHHGYVARMRNVLQALGLPAERFEVLLVQLVSLVREGKPMRMGKRLGNLITVDEVLEEIDEALWPGAGNDALRYYYLSRRSDVPVELDVEVAKKQGINENQAIYLQYGHARLCSILRNAKNELGLDVPHFQASLARKLTLPSELSMVQLLGQFPAVVAHAVRELNPSKIISYLDQLSESFNSYYTQTKNAKDPILPLKSQRAVEGWQASWDRDKTLARLLWVDTIRQVYAAGLNLVGIQALERMVRQEHSSEDSNEG
jgi:arginyl-tRNA synthetase